MGGNVESLEPTRARRVYRGGGYGERISALETRMTVVETASREAASNSAELLALFRATKGAAAFAKKHGPRAVAFVTGVMSAAGLGNPKVLHFIASFFGSG